MCVSTAQVCSKSAARVLQGLGPRHFSWEFSHNNYVALLTCPCAFRLRRLAENVRPNLGPGIFPENSSVKWLLRDLHVHFDCAGSRKMLGWLWLDLFCIVAGAILCRPRRIPLRCSCRISTAQSRTKRRPKLRSSKFLSTRSLHDPVQALHRRYCGDPGEVLSKRSLHEDLADAMSYRCLSESSCGGLLGGSCLKILSDPPQQQQVLL